MNLLDENFPEDQVPLLRQWGLRVRRGGAGVARLGAKDSDLIPLLHRLRGVTFFTQDFDFFDSTLCHRAYGLVWLDVRADDTAHFVRRFLKHLEFSTKARRLGVVARVHHDGIQFWRHGHARLRRVAWQHR